MGISITVCRRGEITLCRRITGIPPVLKINFVCHVIPKHKRNLIGEDIHVYNQQEGMFPRNRVVNDKLWCRMILGNLYKLQSIIIYLV